MMTKQIIQEYINDVSMDSAFDDKTPDQTIAYIRSLQEDYGDIMFRIMYCYGDGPDEVGIYRIREETDSEYNKRLAKEKKEKEILEKKQKKAEEIQYEMYLQLKKKFEP